MVSGVALITVAFVCGTYGVQVSKEVPGTIVLGHKFNTSINYTTEPNEVVKEINFQRKRANDSRHLTILIITLMPGGNAITHIDTTLASRTNITTPSGQLQGARIEFDDAICSDEGDYRWVLTGTGGYTALNFVILVKAMSNFYPYGSLTYLSQVPSHTLEGENVTFKCTGDVGSNPIGRLAWYLFRPGDSAIEEDVTNQSIYSYRRGRPCSYTGTSTLHLTMTSDMDGVVVRCTVHQNHYTSTGDGYMQLNPLPVYYPPRNVVIHKVYTPQNGVQLTCSADSNPSAVFHWVTPAILHGRMISAINIKHSMVYTCVAYVTIQGRNYTANATIVVSPQQTNTIITTTESPSTSNVPIIASSRTHVYTTRRQNRLCYACHDMNHIGLCDAVRSCSSNEECYVKSSVFAGEVVYSSGCMESKLCHSEEKIAVTMPTTCMKCCTDDYCNNNGCGDVGMPPRNLRGPLCYDCEHISSPSACHRLVLCHKNQLCSIEEYEWGELLQYRMGCYSDTCAGSKRSLVKFAGTEKRAVPIRHSCCHDDYCNRNNSILGTVHGGSAGIIG